MEILRGFLVVNTILISIVDASRLKGEYNNHMVEML